MLVKVCHLGLGNGKSVILYILLKNLTSIDLSRTCSRHVPIILDVSIEVSQFKEYRIVIVSRCLVPVGPGLGWDSFWSHLQGRPPAGSNFFLFQRPGFESRWRYMFFTSIKSCFQLEDALASGSRRTPNLG